MESQACSAVGIYSVHSATTWIQPSISTRRPKSVPKALTTNWATLWRRSLTGPFCISSAALKDRLWKEMFLMRFQWERCQCSDTAWAGFCYIHSTWRIELWKNSFPPYKGELQLSNPNTCLTNPLLGAHFTPLCAPCLKFNAFRGLAQQQNCKSVANESGFGRIRRAKQ